MPSKYLVVSGAIFGVIALLQAVRVVYQWPVQIADVDVPLWVSVAGAAVAGGMSIWAFVCAQCCKKPK